MKTENISGNQPEKQPFDSSRRHLMQGALAATAGLVAAGTTNAFEKQPAFAELKGRIKQSMV